jgi:hypothetical protein
VGATVQHQTENRRFDTVSQLELFEDLFHVALNRGRTYAQFGSDLFVAPGSSN